MPENWLLCDGSAVSRTEYNLLFSIIGTSYGVGDGSTTFNLPNLKGRVTVGKDSTQTEFDNLGEIGGEKTHTLTIAEMPSHNHTYDITSNDGAEGWARNGNWNAYGQHTTGNTGGGQPHNILQPYQVTNYIIKARQSSGLVATVVDGLNSTSTTDALSANQGRVLNEKIIPNYMTATISSSYSSPSGLVTVPLDRVAESNGNKLTLSNNKIVIGSGVSYVRVNGAIFLNSPSNGYLWTTILKNDTAVAAVLGPTQNDDFVSVAVPGQLVAVQEGDTISLRSDAAAASIRSGRMNTWLSVEVVY